MSCERIEELLAAHALGALPDADIAEVRAHLAGCAGCRAAGAGMRSAADILALSVEPVTPPRALRARVMAAVQADVRATAPPARAPWWRGAWRRIPAGRPLTAAGLAFAVATGALAVALVVHRGSGSPPPTVASACGLVGEPRTCGTLSWDPATHAGVLTVTGMEPIPTVGGVPTASYEVWLVRADHSAVAAAFLVPSPDHRTMTAALQGDLGAFVSVDTTREPAGGSDAPTGPDLLHIQLPAAS